MNGLANVIQSVQPDQVFFEVTICSHEINSLINKLRRYIGRDRGYWVAHNKEISIWRRQSGQIVAFYIHCATSRLWGGAVTENARPEKCRTWKWLEYGTDQIARLKKYIIHLYSPETVANNEKRIMQLSPQSTFTMTPVSSWLSSPRNSKGNIGSGAPNDKGVGKIRNFQPIRYDTIICNAHNVCQ